MKRPPGSAKQPAPSWHSHHAANACHGGLREKGSHTQSQRDLVKINRIAYCGPTNKQTGPPASLCCLLWPMRGRMKKAPVFCSAGSQLPYYTILYYTILYYTILYYTILYYTILYYTILYYTILYYTILYYTILYYTILYYTILYYTILYYTILYYTILYYTILYYTILHYDTTILYTTIQMEFDWSSGVCFTHAMLYYLLPLLLLLLFGPTYPPSISQIWKRAQQLLAISITPCRWSSPPPADGREDSCAFSTNAPHRLGRAPRT